MFDLHEALRFVVRSEGSDLHLKVGSRPLARIHGQLRPIEQCEPLSRRGHRAGAARDARGPPGEARRSSTTESEVDFAYAVEGLARFRVNAFRQRGSVSVVARVIPFAVRTVAELGLPPVICRARRRGARADPAHRARPARASRRRSRRSSTTSTRPRHATSSRSRIRSSTCTPTATRSSTSARSGWTPPRSAARCAVCCARTRT